MIRPFDEFDLEASSIVTIIAFEGCSRKTHDKIAAELRKFDSRHREVRTWFATFSLWCSQHVFRRRQPKRVRTTITPGIITFASQECESHFLMPGQIGKSSTPSNTNERSR